MKTKIIHELEEDEGNVARRILSVDKAFGLLWDIANDDIRNYFKYKEEPTKEDAEELLEKIRGDIYESGLLDLYE